MAKVLKAFDFRMYGGRKQYDWEMILDGKIRELKKGVDFHSNVRSCYAAIQQTARRRGMRARCRVLDDETIVIQAIRPDAGNGASQ